MWGEKGVQPQTARGWLSHITIFHHGILSLNLTFQVVPKVNSHQCRRIDHILFDSSLAAFATFSYCVLSDVGLDYSLAPGLVKVRGSLFKTTLQTPHLLACLMLY